MLSQNQLFPKPGSDIDKLLKPSPFVSIFDLAAEQYRHEYGRSYILKLLHEGEVCLFYSTHLSMLAKNLQINPFDDQYLKEVLLFIKEKYSQSHIENIIFHITADIYEVFKKDYLSQREKRLDSRAPGLSSIDCEEIKQKDEYVLQQYKTHDQAIKAFVKNIRNKRDKTSSPMLKLDEKTTSQIIENKYYALLNEKLITIDGSPADDPLRYDIVVNLLREPDNITNGSLIYLDSISVRREDIIDAVNAIDHPKKTSRAINRKEAKQTSAREDHNNKAAIALLAFALAKENQKYRHGDNINKAAISEGINALLQSLDPTTETELKSLNKRISEGLNELGLNDKKITNFLKKQ